MDFYCRSHTHPMSGVFCVTEPFRTAEEVERESGRAGYIPVSYTHLDIIPLNQNLRVGVKTEAGKTKIKLSGYQDDFYTAVLKI